VARDGIDEVNPVENTSFSNTYVPQIRIARTTGQTRFSQTPGSEGLSKNASKTLAPTRIAFL